MYDFQFIKHDKKLWKDIRENVPIIAEICSELIRFSPIQLHSI